MVTLNELKTEAEPYLNTLVLDLGSFEVVRLAGIEEDSEDYYWVYDTLQGRMEGLSKRGENGEYLYKLAEQAPRRFWSSAVMGWTPLKGVIPERDYQALLSCFNYNHPQHAK